MTNEHELVSRYSEVKQKIDKLNEERTEIRNELASILHSEDVNEKIIEDDYGTNWKVAYQKSSRRKVDYSLLLTELGEDKYDEIVESNEVVSFVVRKAPKTKVKKDITDVPPKEISKKSNGSQLPKGIIGE